MNTSSLTAAISGSPEIQKIAAFLSERNCPAFTEWENTIEGRAEWRQQLNNEYKLRVVYDQKATYVLRFYFSKDSLPEIEVSPYVFEGADVPTILEHVNTEYMIQSDFSLV